LKALFILEEGEYLLPSEELNRLLAVASGLSFATLEDLTRLTLNSMKKMEFQFMLITKKRRS